ncbi:FCS-LIKE ZINC FINGER 17 [Salix viminalis]|uniref:FCS-LIKE ZINC FINGER 17 n=1 Tax=Salix viminalis TaxID=40686 RepID=A0A9Q0T7F9_SALVM|nr:FCS-LIKE ZINC FINGER 17 [Salix viminalis]
MLTIFKIPFKMEGRLNEEAIAKSTYASSKKGLMAAGLQTLLLEGDISNVVTKSALKTHRLDQVQASSTEHGYLKSCYLCSKILSLDKDVYMYRGDQGFCSKECRKRQIVLDEMRELEASCKERLKPYKHCSSTAGRHETLRVLEELRRSHKPLPRENHWTIAS